MDENKSTNGAPMGEIYNLGSNGKKPSILGKLLGGAFSGGAKLTTAAPAGAVPATTAASTQPTGNALGAAIGAQMEQEKKQAAVPTSIAELLGPKPEFNPAVIEEKRRREELSARSMFYGAVACALVIFGYFQFQLNPEVTVLFNQFGPNSAVQFEQGNAEIKKLQTDSNIVQHRIARLWLDVINAKSDAFTKAVNDVGQMTNLTQKAATEKQVAVLSTEIKEALGAIQGIFSQDLGIDTYTPLPVSFAEREAEFVQLIKQRLNEQKQTLRGSATDDKTIDEKDVRAIDSVLRLVENKRVRALIRNAQLKQLSNEDLAKLLADIRAEGIDEFAHIEKLKQQRVDWEKLITNIHQVVQTADPHYGHGLFKTVGGFMFSSYRFDEKTARVSISGVTKTSDSKTFSFIATLIDAIEKSPYFADIDFRSFSKTRDESGDFSAGINLEFGIEKN